MTTKPTEEILARLRSKFRGYHIEFRDIPEEPHLIGVAVFGVETEFIASVEDEIFNAEELVTHLGYALIPMVKSLETTRNYYPRFLDGWETSQTSSLSSEAICETKKRKTDCFGSGFRVLQLSGWNSCDPAQAIPGSNIKHQVVTVEPDISQNSQGISQANEELALAA